MTIRTSLIFLCGFLFTSSLAQHIPPCSGDAGNQNHHAACNDYAQARAFGRSWNDGTCPASTVTAGIPTTTYYDIWTADLNTILQSVQGGDILRFNGGGHYCYVVLVDSRDIDGVKIAQVNFEGDSEREFHDNVRYTLRDVIQGLNGLTTPGLGNPDQYIRRKLAWQIKLENHFSDNANNENIKLGSDEQESPHAWPVDWNVNYEMNAVMNEAGRTHSSLAQHFDDWRTNDDVVVSTTQKCTTKIEDKNPANIGWYIAHFRNNYGVTFAGPSYIESQFPGGYYKVNDVQSSSTSIVEDESKKIEAVPSTSWAPGFAFVRWSDNAADNAVNPRNNYSPNDNVTLSAKFKAHLGSSMPSATGMTSQRKMIYAYTNGYWTFHTVYESGGEVWYTKSTDNGQTWSSEMLLSRGSGTAHNPSISEVASCATCLYAVWVDATIRPGATGYDIQARKMNNSTGVWSGTEAVSLDNNSTGFAAQNAHPVAISYKQTSNSPWVVIAYEKPAGSGLRYSWYSYFDEYDDYVWMTQEVGSGTSGLVNPSISFTCIEYQRRIHILA